MLVVVLLVGSETSRPVHVPGTVYPFRSPPGPICGAGVARPGPWRLPTLPTPEALESEIRPSWDM
jgi:hypothetical protein